MSDKEYNSIKDTVSVKKVKRRKKLNTRKLTYTGFFIALGIVLPQLFHILGGPGIGKIFLPMHIPVLIGAMTLGPAAGVLIGGASVIVGFSLGMPTLPMAVFMFFELMVYGAVGGYLGYKKRVNIYASLVATMISGRTVSFILMNLAVNVIGFKLPPIFGTTALYVMGVPGTVIQIIIVPVIIYTLRRFLNFDGNRREIRVTEK